MHFYFSYNPCTFTEKCITIYLDTPLTPSAVAEERKSSIGFKRSQERKVISDEPILPPHSYRPQLSAQPVISHKGAGSVFWGSFPDSLLMARSIPEDRTMR